MSLINDALKRAKQTRQQSATPAAPVSPPPSLYRPLETAPRRARTGWFLPGMVVLLILAGMICIGVTLFRRPAAKASTEQTFANENQSSAAATPPETTPAPAPRATSKPSSQPSVPATIYPLPKVQGIVFSPAKPWAIVNGKTVFVGDTIGNLRVQSISRDKVVVVGGGRTNELFIGN